MHGDAHLNNCFFTADRPLWGDLEDACLAPVEWDAACLAVIATGAMRYGPDVVGERLEWLRRNAS